MKRSSTPLKTIIRSVRRIAYSRRGFVAGAWLLSVARIGTKVFPTALMDALVLHVGKLLAIIAHRSGLMLYTDSGGQIEPWVVSALSDLERCLREVGTRSAARLTAAGARREVAATDMVFATSFVSAKGGHGRLLGTYLGRLKRSALLLSGEAILKRRQQRVAFIEDQRAEAERMYGTSGCSISVDQDPTLSPFRKYRSLYFRLEAIQPRLIVLFANVTDIPLVLSVWVYRKQHQNVRVLYYHHADDYFPFFGASFDAHIDLDANQESKCRHIAARHLIRISVPERASTGGSCRWEKAGTAFSFIKPDKAALGTGSPEYFALVAQLTRIGMRVVLATTRGGTQKLMEQLVSCSARLPLITIDENCLDIAQYRNVANFYLDTFPIGGGMSVVDALSIGLPVALNAAPGNQIFRDPVLEHFMFAGTPEIVSYVGRLGADPAYYAQERNIAYEVYRRHYSESIMLDQFAKAAGDVLGRKPDVDGAHSDNRVGAGGLVTSCSDRI